MRQDVRKPFAVRLGLQREWLGYATDARALGIVPGSRATLP